MLLEVKSLTKVYKRGSTSFKAVDQANFSMDRKELVSIVGRSGSGKSTLLNMIAGLIKPSEGSVLLDGKDTRDCNDTEGSYIRNARIGYIPQGQSILSNFSVIDNVRLPYFLSKRSGNPTDRAFSLLEKVGISHLAFSFPSQLSGGEIKRVDIARALINSPDILIADEPTSSLDLQTTREIMQLFRSLSDEGSSILIVTHEPEVSCYCKRTLHMKEGKLSEEKSIEIQ
jgi:putative ABC transport system ATP-binding protein